MDSERIYVVIIFFLLLLILMLFKYYPMNNEAAIFLTVFFAVVISYAYYHTFHQDRPFKKPIRMRTLSLLYDTAEPSRFRTLDVPENHIYIKGNDDDLSTEEVAYSNVAKHNEIVANKSTGLHRSGNTVLFSGIQHFSPSIEGYLDPDQVVGNSYLHIEFESYNSQTRELDIKITNTAPSNYFHLIEFTNHGLQGGYIIQGVQIVKLFLDSDLDFTRFNIQNAGGNITMYYTIFHDDISSVTAESVNYVHV